MRPQDLPETSFVPTSIKWLGGWCDEAGEDPAALKWDEAGKDPAPQTDVMDDDDDGQDQDVRRRYNVHDGDERRRARPGLENPTRTLPGRRRRPPIFR